MGLLILASSCCFANCLLAATLLILAFNLRVCCCYLLAIVLLVLAQVSGMLASFDQKERLQKQAVQHKICSFAINLINNYIFCNIF